MIKTSKRRILAILTTGALVCSVAFSACSAPSAPNETAPAFDSSAATRTAQQSGGADMAGVAGGALENGAAPSSPQQAPAAKAPTSEQKIIQRYTYRIETLEFDKSVQAIQDLTTQLQGYVQESGVDGDGAVRKNNSRFASYVLRIPQANIPQLKEKAATIGSVLNFSTSSENITESYYDTEARLKSLKAQQERLLELMKQADKMADIVELEKGLADVVFQIEQITGTLKQYDSLINYSTVTIELTEVSKATIIEKTPVTLAEKISYQFSKTLRWISGAAEGFVVMILGGFPIILLIAVCFIAGRILYRKKKKGWGHKKTDAANSPAESAEAPQLPPSDKEQ